MSIGFNFTEILYKSKLDTCYCKPSGDYEGVGALLMLPTM